MDEPLKEDTPVVVDGKAVPKKRGKGRPPKSEIEEVKNKRKGLGPGRPPGDAARIQEFKARLLATGGNKIIDKMVNIALTDGHPGQMAAIKLAVDRLLPISLFEEAKAGGGGAPTIQISITGLDTPKAVVEDITDVQIKEYRDE